MYNNVSSIRDCYGCGVCAVACNKQIIEIRENRNGFYEPQIKDFSACTECGRCVKVCSYVHSDLSLKDQIVHAYAAWSRDECVRRRSSSGGVGFELADTLMRSGYKVCAVRYNVARCRAEHYIATKREDLALSSGSKYIQSFAVDGFNAINLKEKHLVIGTPCQIDSFRRYIQLKRKEDNFILVDFFCHGVPSGLMWKKYVQWAEHYTGKLSYVSWRNKHTGWHDSWAMVLSGENGRELVSKWSTNDMFYNLFLGDCCLGKACYNRCKFKYDKSAADIRIGDLWGQAYQDDEDGVSAVVTFTSRGEEAFHSLNCERRERGMDIVGEGQMKTAARMTFAYSIVMRLLRNDNVSIVGCDKALKWYQRCNRNMRRLLHPITTAKKMLPRLKNR